MEKINEVYRRMIEYYSGDPKRIQHFIKVHSLCRLIGQLEGLGGKELFTLECAGLTHDIGIKNAEAKYGSCGGKLQEKEGPPEAERLLREAGVPEDVISRVCLLISRHHTYDNMDGLDCRILVEADFLVNLYEDNIPEEGARSAFGKIFRTKTGSDICRSMFGI